MNDLSSYRQLIEEQLHMRLEQCNRLVPQHLMSVIRGYLEHGGKRLRPILVMLSCEGFGGSTKDAVVAGAAVEMYHNWTLMHDDIIDHDALRRNRPTGHIIGAENGVKFLGLDANAARDYGISVAILAGDMLHGLAVETLGVLRDSYPDVIPTLMFQMSGCLGRELIGGEQMDVELSHRAFESVNEPLVRLMMTGKTGALLRYALQCGTALALNTLRDSRIALMGRFGNMLGTSFQLQDDWLGIFGDETKLGKPVGSDIREGKRTLLAVKTLQMLTGADRERFLELYGNAEVTEQDIDTVRQLMRASGAGDYVKKVAAASCAEALVVLGNAMPQSKQYQMLVELTQSLMTREA